MKTLAEQNPTIVKPITLPFKTYEGRSVEGIEITTDVKARDGKPVFLNMGVHHAREWPSGEHAMEWAHELVKGYKAGDARVRRLMDATRTIVIPIVNPDGFNASREAGEDDGREGPDETANLALPYEYHRKNCRVVNPTGDDPAEGDCTQQPATGLQQFGVDPNRNYGGYWGGPGASAPGGTPPGDYAQDYRGPGPFSEPETQNIRDLVSKRQVVTLITNHTASNLILRPPGIQALGNSPDEDLGYKALGDAMAAENGYTSQFGYELYDTTGTTEDWTYSATGGFGFTFEIGCEDKDEDTQECGAFHFHPSYQKVVAEYEGTSVEADENGRDGLGNREAYFIAMESTANAARHSVIAGNAPPGAVLRLSKSFKTSTSPVITGGVEGEPILFDDKLESVLEVPSSGSYSWHTNPSIRPQVARDTGRTATGPPSPEAEFTGGVTGTGEPGDDGVAAPGGDANSNDPMNNNDHVVAVPQGGGVDNAKIKIRVEWATPASDWDVRLYADANSDEVPDDPTSSLSASQTGPSSFEVVGASESVTDPKLAPQYIVRVTNFASGPEGDYTGTVTYEGPDPFVAAIRESWTPELREPVRHGAAGGQGRDRARPAQGGQPPGLRDRLPGGLQDRRGLRPADRPDQGQAARPRAPRPLAYPEPAGLPDQPPRASERRSLLPQRPPPGAGRLPRVGAPAPPDRPRVPATSEPIGRSWPSPTAGASSSSACGRGRGRASCRRCAAAGARCASGGSGGTPGTSRARSVPAWSSRSATSGCARSASPTSA